MLFDSVHQLLPQAREVLTFEEVETVLRLAL
jgi:hypothetical protein